VQQELRPGFSVSAGYYHNWYGSLNTVYTGRGISTGLSSTLYRLAVDNQAVTPTDFDPFCITAPVDPRLPNGGGHQVCGLYDITPARFGQVNNLVVPTSKFGDAERSADFLNVGFQARFADLTLGGGVDTGRIVNDFCFVIDSPQELLNCRIVTPPRGLTDLKFNSSYRLPGDFVVAGLLQSIPGPAIDADYAVPNAQIEPFLGRSLAACGARTGTACTASVTVPLYRPQTECAPRRWQVDLRLGKMFELGSKARLQANLDAYNVFNANPVLALISAYGPRWQRPTTFLDGRLFTLSGQLTF
jgi:hypothetical protein